MTLVIYSITRSIYTSHEVFLFQIAVINIKDNFLTSKVKFNFEVYPQDKIAPEAEKKYPHFFAKSS